MSRRCSLDGGRSEVAITGLGAVTCIGTELGEIAASLRSGRSGIGIDEERQRRGFRSALTGRVTGFDPGRYGLTRKLLRTMCEPAQYAYAATLNAVADAGLPREALGSERCGLIFGNDSTARATNDSLEILREHGGTHFIGGSHVFRGMNSTVSMNLSVLLGIRGACWTVSAACASGGHAIGQALLFLRSGIQDIVLAGGAQETNWESMASFDALGAFSTRQDAPEQASRPFDADRDGLVPSGGAACLVLEDLDHARGRGARIYGFVRGYGFSNDGCHLTQPSGEGGVRAMRMALADAGVAPGDIDYVNAHATSTILGDRAEAEGIAQVFGPSVPVSSTKSMVGHECWMAGASGVLYTVLMAKEGFIAPNVNFSRFDDGCPPINVVREPLHHRMRTALSNSFGFGGTNATLVLDFRL